jgi:hypothetical protein
LDKHAMDVDTAETIAGVVRLLRQAAVLAWAAADRAEAGSPGQLFARATVAWQFPPHIGMRQCWRDFDLLERWARAEPQKWWQGFLWDSAGTGFWRETYFIQGGMETIIWTLTHLSDWGVRSNP